MPRQLIDVNETWVGRFNRVIPAAIDTLTGWEHQCQSSLIDGIPEPDDLVEQLQAQLRDLRRNLETIRLIF